MKTKTIQLLLEITIREDIGSPVTREQIIAKIDEMRGVVKVDELSPSEVC